MDPVFIGAVVAVAIVVGTLIVVGNLRDPLGPPETMKAVAARVTIPPTLAAYTNESDPLTISVVARDSHGKLHRLQGATWSRTPRVIRAQVFTSPDIVFDKAPVFRLPHSEQAGARRAMRTKEGALVPFETPLEIKVRRSKKGRAQVKAMRG